MIEVGPALAVADPARSAFDNDSQSTESTTNSMALDETDERPGDLLESPTSGAGPRPIPSTPLRSRRGYQNLQRSAVANTSSVLSPISLGTQRRSKPSPPNFTPSQKSPGQHRASQMLTQYSQSQARRTQAPASRTPFVDALETMSASQMPKFGRGEDPLGHYDALSQAIQEMTETLTQRTNVAKMEIGTHNMVRLTRFYSETASDMIVSVLMAGLNRLDAKHSLLRGRRPTSGKENSAPGRPNYERDGREDDNPLGDELGRLAVIEVALWDRRRCELRGRIFVESCATNGLDYVASHHEDMSRKLIVFRRISGDPLEWRRFFRSMVQNCWDIVCVD